MNIRSGGAIVAALALAISVAGASAADAKPKKKPKLPSPHVGQVAKDGDFAFKVTFVHCGVESVGTAPLTETAPAGTQWCLVTMSVKNDKTGAQDFFASNQYAYDGKGNKLSADSGALIYVDSGPNAIIASVNPGVSITTTVPYQIPTTSKIKRFELHDSAFSGGVTVWNVA